MSDEQLEKAIREAIRQNPDDAFAHAGLGVVLYHLKRYEEAEEEYREAIRLNPKFVWARYNLGIVLHKLNRHKEAEEEGGLK